MCVRSHFTELVFLFIHLLWDDQPIKKTSYHLSDNLMQRDQMDNAKIHKFMSTSIIAA